MAFRLHCTPPLAGSPPPRLTLRESSTRIPSDCSNFIRLLQFHHIEDHGPTETNRERGRAHRCGASFVREYKLPTNTPAYASVDSLAASRTPTVPHQVRHSSLCPSLSTASPPPSNHLFFLILTEFFYLNTTCGDDPKRYLGFRKASDARSTPRTLGVNNYHTYTYERRLLPVPAQSCSTYRFYLRETTLIRNDRNQPIGCLTCT